MYSPVKHNPHDGSASGNTSNESYSNVSIPYKLYATAVTLANEVMQQVRDSVKSLESCPKELYINFGLKFCESYNYFAISQILVIYLHDEFGLSDMAAGGWI